MSLVYKSMYFELGWIIGQLAVFFVWQFIPLCFYLALMIFEDLAGLKQAKQPEYVPEL